MDTGRRHLARRLDLDLSYDVLVDNGVKPTVPEGRRLMRIATMPLEPGADEAVAAWSAVSASAAVNSHSSPISILFILWTSKHSQTLKASSESRVAQRIRATPSRSLSQPLTLPCSRLSSETENDWSMSSILVALRNLSRRSTAITNLTQ